MPIPTRSRSLRQPGFAQRELRAVANPGSRNINKEKEPPFSSHTFDPGRQKAGSTNDRNPPELPECRSTGEKENGLHTAVGEPATPDGEAAVPLEVTFHSRLPSPTKMTTSAANRKPISHRNLSSSNFQPTDGIAMPQKSQIARSSSFRHPSSRLALTQPGNSRGHGKSLSASHSCVESLQTVAESAKNGPHDSAYDTPAGEYESNANVVPVRQANAASHQRKLSSARSIRRTSPELSESASLNTKLARTRPQFSTYQQHFTPKRVPKALTEDVKDPHLEGDPSHSVSIETSQLQDELLQLSLIYTSAHLAKREWEQNAKKQMQRQFKRIVRQSEEQAFTEQTQQTHHNLDTLQQWLNQGSHPPTEKLEVLSQYIRDIKNLMRSDGKAMYVIKTFQEWLSLVTSATDSKDDQEVTSIDPLGSLWKDQAQAAIQALEHCQRQLQKLGPTDITGAIGKTLDYHAKIATQTIAELNLMLEVEGMTLEYVREYTTRAITEILVLAESELLPSETPRKGIWNTI